MSSREYAVRSPAQQEREAVGQRLRAAMAVPCDGFCADLLGKLDTLSPVVTDPRARPAA